MALLCYNKGCGLKFDADKNKEGESLRVFVSLSTGIFMTGAILNVVLRETFSGSVKWRQKYLSCSDMRWFVPLTKCEK